MKTSLLKLAIFALAAATLAGCSKTPEAENTAPPPAASNMVAPPPMPAPAGQAKG